MSGPASRAPWVSVGDAPLCPGLDGSLAAELHPALARLKPQHLQMTAPGDWRVWQALKASAQAARLGLELELELRDDRHSYTMVREFAAHAKGRSTVRLEYFYRALRQRHGVLLHDGAPLGGQ